MNFTCHEPRLRADFENIYWRSGIQTQTLGGCIGMVLPWEPSKGSGSRMCDNDKSIGIRGFHIPLKACGYRNKG